MLSIIKRNVKTMNGHMEHDGVLYDVRCLSTDTKPLSGMTNGSHCLEIDTGDEFLFNATTNEWEEYTPAGGGGGGSSLPSAYGEEF